MAKKKFDNKVVIKNKRATFDYEILDTYTAGIVLYGTEIKSIRLGKASLVDTYCIAHNGEIWVKNMYIGEYFYGTYNNHEPRRDRKLLLNKREIRTLSSEAKNTGITLIPVRLFISEKGLAKLVVGIAKGKKQYDKRASLKEKDQRREMDAVKKVRY
ncbi:SsrA-binding protein SmpB [Porphyromonas sp.]|uniref:SsrA-binding protein SmpB n=1 Tax=Porphyromonas sp. TaxID=1924944 RepID=UPI0026DAB52A|nr:SsrA-binding protein SmpB [Porphyromonas sp.]MDO4695334.1 SsrA-binding protein SmpB [Porphyromonas sp.]MDO4771094.1 SsrA-binding protein SmpB [Porphyromonas sp.]